MKKTKVPDEPIRKFRLFVEKCYNKEWSSQDRILYLNIAVLAWNTSLLKKPERITEIQNYITNQKCPLIQLGNDTYDTLELTVALAHLKKALYPEVRKKILSVDFQEETNNFHIILFNP